MLLVLTVPLVVILVLVNGTFSGDVSIAGTITYDDVTHVDSQGIGTFRQGINVVGHSEVDTLRASGIATFQSNVHLADNVKINLGTGDDLQIYHDGSNSYIKESGTGLAFKSWCDLVNLKLETLVIVKSISLFDAWCSRTLL